jgi:hypothetical protein
MEMPKRSPATCGAARAKPEKLRMPPLTEEAGAMGTLWENVLVRMRPVVAEPTSTSGELSASRTGSLRGELSA